MIIFSFDECLIFNNCKMVFLGWEYEASDE